MPHCKTVKHYEDLFAVRRDYELRADGKRIGVTETLQVTDGNGSSGEQTNVIDWEYDALGRLVDEVFDTELQTYDNPWEQTEDGSTRPRRDYADHYEFDLAGNRVRKTNGNKTGIRGRSSFFGRE